MIPDHYFAAENEINPNDAKGAGASSLTLGLREYPEFDLNQLQIE